MVIQNKIGNIAKNRLMMMISLSFIICPRRGTVLYHALAAVGKG